VADDAELVARLRAGDEGAFVTLVDRYHAPLLRLASTFVPSRAVAEEVVQDAWLGVVKGIGRFEGRSSLKTWLFRIVVNRARSTGVRERRHISVDLGDEPAVPANRFDADGEWIDPPAPIVERAEEQDAARQAAAKIAGYLPQLPEAQRQVVVMRDFEGLPATEVCSVLGISEGNQRVLLHRGRSRIRAMLERDMGAA
jgi:RNA polymerase sigma-70 factor (ECF subfamily)